MQTQLATFFQIIGEAQVPTEQQPARLRRSPSSTDSCGRRSPQARGHACSGALKDAARAALDAGRLEGPTIC